MDYGVSGYVYICSVLYKKNTSDQIQGLEIAVRVFGLSFLAPPFQQLSTARASFLPPFSNVLSRLPDAPLDVLNLGCHVAVDLLEIVDKLDKFSRSESRQTGLWTLGSARR